MSRRTRAGAPRSTVPTSPRWDAPWRLARLRRASFNTLVNATGLDAIGRGHPVHAQYRRTSRAWSRFDWNPGQVHSVIFTGQLQLNGTDPQGIGQTSLSQVGGNNTSSQGSGGLRVTVALPRNGHDQRLHRRLHRCHQELGSVPAGPPAGRVTNYSALDSLGVYFNHDVRLRRQLWHADVQHYEDGRNHQ